MRSVAGAELVDDGADLSLWLPFVLWLYYWIWMDSGAMTRRARPPSEGLIYCHGPSAGLADGGSGAGEPCGRPAVLPLTDSLPEGGRSRGGGEPEGDVVSRSVLHSSVPADRRLLSSPALSSPRGREAQGSANVRRLLILCRAMDTWARKRDVARRRLGLFSTTLPLTLPLLTCTMRTCAGSRRRSWLRSPSSRQVGWLSSL